MTHLLVGIIAALAIFSAAMYLIGKHVPNMDMPELFVRIKMWWGMIAVFSLATWIHPVISLITLSFLCLFSLREFFSMRTIRKYERNAYTWAYLAIPLQFYWIYTSWYGMFVLFIPLYVFLFIPVIRIFKGGGTVGFLRTVSNIQWGLMLTVFALSHLAYFPKLSEDGSKLVLFVVILTQLNDVVQYFVSKTFGKLKVVPSANPHITWEGLILGVILTTLASFGLAPSLTPMEALDSLLAGILISCSGFFGAIVISVVRRDLLISDENKNIPFKDSFLTRIDSLIYATPLFFHFIRFFYI